MLSQVAELDADGRFRKSGQQQILIELLLLRFSFLDRTVELEDVLRAIGGSPPLPGPGPAAVREAPAPPSAPQPAPAQPSPTSRASAPAPAPLREAEPAQAPAPASGPLELRQLRQAWKAVIEEGEGVPAGMGLVLRSTQVAIAGDDAVRVEVPLGSPLLERMESASGRRPLEQALSRRLQRPIRISFASAGNATAESGGHRITAETAKRDRLRRLTEEEPLLASAVQEWDLELID
jgi:hypothetical protein